MEQVKMGNGTVFIHWHIKNVNVGSRGALGMVTQAKVESISVRAMGVFSATDAKGHSADVFQQKNNNEYFIPINGKLEKITTVKHLYKLFPKHKEKIKAFIKEQGIKMNEPILVLELLNYCLGLE